MYASHMRILPRSCEAGQWHSPNPGGGIFNALTTSNEIPTLVSEKHFNPRQDLECSTGGAGRKPKHRPTCFIHRWRNFSAFGRELRFAALLKFSAVLGGFFMLPA